jgi:hypothetical protein
MDASRSILQMTVGRTHDRSAWAKPAGIAAAGRSNPQRSTSTRRDRSPEDGWPGTVIVPLGRNLRELPRLGQSHPERSKSTRRDRSPRRRLAGPMIVPLGRNGLECRGWAEQSAARSRTVATGRFCLGKTIANCRGPSDNRLLPLANHAECRRNPQRPTAIWRPALSVSLPIVSPWRSDGAPCAARTPEAGCR